LKQTVFTVPASRAASSISFASARVLASGFSQITCFPASSAASTISRCVFPGVTTSTSPTSSRSMSLR
jgi:hypothetical protein